MKAVALLAAARHEPENLGAAGQSMIVVFQDESCGAFPHDESIAVLRERLGSGGGQA